MNWNVVQRFAKAASRYPDSPAIVAGQTELTYSDLRQLVRGVAAQLRPALRQGRVGVLGSRSIEACVAFLGTHGPAAPMYRLASTIPISG